MAGYCLLHAKTLLVDDPGLRSDFAGIGKGIENIVPLWRVATMDAALGLHKAKHLGSHCCWQLVVATWTWMEWKNERRMVDSVY